MSEQQRTTIEPLREIPVSAEADVVVAGAGLGGVAATLAAARAGARTVLIDRNSCLGGVSTAGMCCSIFNCYHTRKRELGTSGIAVEVADALAEAEGFGLRWREHKGHIIYDIERAKVQFERMVRRAGARLMLQAVVAGVTMDADRITGLVIEDKGGRAVVRAGVVVDATGDADVAALSGAAVRTVKAGRHSLCFRMGNVDVDAFVGYFRKHPEQYPDFMDVEWTASDAIAQYDACGTFLFPHGGGMQMDAFREAKAHGDLPARVGMHDTTDACQMHALRSTRIVHVVTGFVSFDGLDAARITESILDGREMAHSVAAFYRRYIPGFSNAFVAGTATNLGVRVSRYAVGDFAFTADMMKAGTRHADCVGRAVGWDHPIRHSGPGAWGVQVLRNDSFDLPYRCLLPGAVEGLLMGAGRSVSCEDPNLLRVMAHTMVVGQAAGTAAAVAALRGERVHRLEVSAVQDELRRQGVRL